MTKLRTAISLAALLLCFTATARAQDSEDAEVTRMAKEHYKVGLDAYKAGKYDVAIKELKKAYLLKRLPALLLNIGATYRKMSEFNQALNYYQKYLDEAPADAKDRGEVQKLIAEIEQEKNAPPPPATTQETAPPPAAPQAPTPLPPRREERAEPMPKEWSHVVIDAAPPEQPIDVRVSMPVMKGVKVYVLYRTAGQEQYTEVLMKRRGAEKVGRIPADAVQGKAIQYYVEARDGGGSVVKSSGSKESPNIVMIDPGAKPQVLASGETGAGERPGRGDDDRTGRSNLDEEAAPMPGEVKVGKTQKTHERAKRAASPTGGGGGRFSTLFWAGIGVAAVGVVGLSVGIAGLALAKGRADQVAQASQNAGAQVPPVYYNNDPVASQQGLTQYASLESEGKMWNTVGIAMTVVGSLATVAGVAIIVADRVVLKKPVEQQRPTPSASDAWFIQPVLGPRLAGAVTGFSF